MALREYQERIINEARDALRRHQAVLIQSPTGSGKTVLASHMLGTASERGKRSFFICHRQELLDQTALTFEREGIPYSFIASGYPHNPFQPVQICSIGTLVGRLDTVKAPDLVVWDEAHHVAAASWDKVFRHYSRARHVGLSATPERLDGQGLGTWFGHMVLGPKVGWLIEEDYLSEYRIFAPSTPDLTAVKTRMGDYAKPELLAAMDKSQITGDIVRHWLKLARGKRTIGFAVSVEHSKHICEEFRRAGVVAVHLDAKSPKAERKMTTKAFAQGKIDVLFNVDLFGEGYDLAAQAGTDVTVEAVILARPTQSLGLHLQQIGRALRRKSEPAIIIDHAGNCLKHGLPDDERTWSLNSEKRKKKKKDEEPEERIAQCPGCYFVHKPGPVCPNCGHVYERQVRSIDHVDGELVELDPEAMRRQRAKEQGTARSLDALIQLGRARGYKAPERWAAKVWTARQAKARAF